MFFSVCNNFGENNFSSNVVSNLLSHMPLLMLRFLALFILSLTSVTVAPPYAFARSLLPACTVAIGLC